MVSSKGLKSRGAYAVLAAAFLIALLAIPAYAQANRVNPAKLTERLLKSYENLKSFLKGIEERLDQDKVDRIEKAIARADPLAEEAKSLLSSGDADSALEKVREALSIIRSVLKEIRDVDVVREGGRIGMSLRRLAAAAARAEVILRALERRGVDVSNLTSKLQEVRPLIEDARSLLTSGDIEGAREKAREAANELRSIYGEIRSLARDHLNLTREKVLGRVKNIERAAERCVVRLDIAYKKLMRENKTEIAQKVLRLKNGIERALVSLKRHVESGQRFLALGDVRRLIGYLRICRRMGGH